MRKGISSLGTQYFKDKQCVNPQLFDVKFYGMNGYTALTIERSYSLGRELLRSLEPKAQQQKYTNESYVIKNQH